VLARVCLRWNQGRRVTRGTELRRVSLDSSFCSVAPSAFADPDIPSPFPFTDQASPISSSTANQRQHPLNVYLNPSPGHNNQHLSPPQPYSNSPSSSTTSPSVGFPISNMYNNAHPSSQTQPQHSGLPPSSSSQPFPLPFVLPQNTVPTQLQQSQQQHPLQNFHHHQPQQHQQHQQQYQQHHHHQQQQQPSAQGALEFSYETVVGEEDLWAGLGNTEGYGWMGLGFDQDLGGGAGGGVGGGHARF